MARLAYRARALATGGDLEEKSFLKKETANVSGAQCAGVSCDERIRPGTWPGDAPWRSADASRRTTPHLAFTQAAGKALLDSLRFFFTGGVASPLR